MGQAPATPLTSSPARTTPSTAPTLDSVSTSVASPRAISMITSVPHTVDASADTERALLTAWRTQVMRPTVMLMLNTARAITATTTTTAMAPSVASMAASAAEATATLATATALATATVLATALATALTTPTVTADTIPATAEDLVPKKADLSAVTSSAAADRTSGEKLNQD